MQHCPDILGMSCDRAGATTDATTPNDVTTSEPAASETELLVDAHDQNTEKEVEPIPLNQTEPEVRRFQRTINPPVRYGF